MRACERQLLLLRLGLWGRQEAGLLADWEPLWVEATGEDTQSVPALDPLGRGVVTSWCCKGHILN